MGKHAKITRAIGFVTALGASAALVAAAAAGTGAYFTDSHDVTATAAVGSVALDNTTTTLNFKDLLPGNYQTQPINYRATGTGPQDVWLVFDSSDWRNQIFTGASGEFGGGGLGRYGHFAVASNAGNFTSYNLSRPTPSDSTAICVVDANGHGGWADQATAGTKYCPVPNAIKIDSNLTKANGVRTAQVTFGFTGRLTDQKAPEMTIPFKIVATQAGVSPLAENK